MNSALRGKIQNLPAPRVVAKAAHLEKGENPRFVVTSLNRRAQLQLFRVW
jgi:hypothetical protein